jgi:hypothetical protein
MSAPITYTDTPINDDYVFTGKKYAISNGRPGSTGFINYRNNPNSKTWHPAYNYDQYHPNGTGYYIISNTRVQGGHATAGNEIPTFQVTGNTDNEILHLINRLQNRTTFYTNIEAAKNSIIADSESLHFDAALSKYAYYAPQFLKLNFDFGNLNCDIKTVGSIGNVYNFTSNLSGYLTDIADDYLFDANDNSSFYRQIGSGVRVPLTIISGLTSVACSATEDFVIAVCVKLENTSNDIQILEISNPACILTFNFSIGKFVFSYRGSTVTTSNPVSSTNAFHTIIFGRKVSTPNDEIFIYVNDDTINNPQYTTTTSTTNSQSLTFDGDFFIGNNSNTPPFYLGILQYWKGTGLVDTTTQSMLGVSQPDFTNEIYNLYTSRWN